MTTSTQPTTGGFKVRITRAYADWNIKEEDYKVKGKPVVFDSPHQAHRVVRELMTQDPEDHVLAFEVVEV